MKPAISLALWIALASGVDACNIPVFRYALERWRPDSCELIIFHDTDLSGKNESFVRDLEAACSENGGASNTKVFRSKVNVESNDEYSAVWDAFRDEQSIQLPYVVVRSKLGRGKTINLWHGSLDDARSSNLLQSPVRKELSRRLLSGDSIVWLLLQSPDKRRTQAVRESISKSFDTLQTKVSLPEGIGLPGSELHSEVPLLLKFSLLEIDRADEREDFLVRLLTAFEPDAIAEGEPLLVPVFGRGRALEVIPARDLNERLVEDVTLFLSGACSCQVKAQNPGFDLLISADWDTQLFGEDGPRPPRAKTIADRNASPELLAIPPGR